MVVGKTWRVQLLIDHKRIPIFEGIIADDEAAARLILVDYLAQKHPNYSFVDGSGTEVEYVVSAGREVYSADPA